MVGNEVWAERGRVRESALVTSCSGLRTHPVLTDGTDGGVGVGVGGVWKERVCLPAREVQRALWRMVGSSGPRRLGGRGQGSRKE